MTIPTLQGQHFENLFVNVPDFPIQGFNFPDITPILERDPEGYRAIIAHLEEPFLSMSIDAVACIESFGYVFGIPIAHRRGARIVCVRRPGKLPRRTVSQTYSMCYSEGREVQVHADSVGKGDRVLVVDDFLASGGTFVATRRAIEQCGGIVVGAAFVCELIDMQARIRREVSEICIHSLFRMRFDSDSATWRIVSTSDGHSSIG
jgi:adenine phosphoribosyltransferase